MNLTQIKDKIVEIKNKLPHLPKISKKLQYNFKFAVATALPIVLAVTVTTSAADNNVVDRDTKLATSMSLKLEDNILEQKANKVEIVVGESEAERIEREANESQAKLASAKTVSVSTTVEVPEEELKAYAFNLVSSQWDISQWEPFDYIVERESGWNWQATNRTSGAYGLGQALPASKMGDLASTPEGQVQWVIAYIEGRYGTPANAQSFWLTHGWY